MEAFARGPKADRFNHALRDHGVYDFTNVGFEPTLTPYPSFWYQQSEYYMTMDRQTILNTPGQHIGFPICPRVFMEFNTVYSRSDRTIAGTSIRKL